MAQITDKREILKRELASILDHPSVFAGGPSQGNLRKAERLIEHLEKNYDFETVNASRPVWLHVRRGTTYSEIGRGFASIAEMPIEDHTAVTIYRGSDGVLWVRNAVEFDDGRFKQVR